MSYREGVARRRCWHMVTSWRKVGDWRLLDTMLHIRTLWRIGRQDAPLWRSGGYCYQGGKRMPGCVLRQGRRSMRWRWGLDTVAHWRIPRDTMVHMV